MDKPILSLTPPVFQMGKRVYLRPLDSTDLLSLLKLDNDPEVNEFFIRYRPVSADLAERRLEKKLLDESGNVYYAPPRIWV